MVHELNLQQTKVFNVKNLIIALVLTFMFGFVLTALFNNDIALVRQYYAILPSIIAIYFCVKTIQYLLLQKNTIKNHDTPYIFMLKMANFGILFMATMPIVVLFGDYQTLNNTLVNVSYFLVFFAYYKFQIYQNHIEYEMVNRLKSKAVNEQALQCKSALPYCLTNKQLEVAYYIFKGLSFKEISKIMFIQQKTVSKHASNIYQNTKCKNKADLIEKFANDIHEIEKLVLEPNLQ